MFEYVQVQMRGMAEGNTIVAPFIIKNSQMTLKNPQVVSGPILCFCFTATIHCHLYMFIFGWTACIVLKLHPLI